MLNRGLAANTHTQRCPRHTQRGNQLLAAVMLLSPDAERSLRTWQPSCAIVCTDTVTEGDELVPGHNEKSEGASQEFVQTADE